MRRFLVFVAWMGCLAILSEQPAMAHAKKMDTEPLPPVIDTSGQAPGDSPAVAVAEAVVAEAEHHVEHELTGLEGVLAWFGRFHPLLVHFPIALLTASLIAELLFLRSARPLFDDAGRFLTHLASIASPPAALLGIFFSWSVDYCVELAQYLWAHRLFGILAALLCVIASILRETIALKHAEGRALYRLSLAAATICVLLAGYLGACLTWGPAHLMP